MKIKMKKTIFTLTAIVGLTFTGCMNDEAPGSFFYSILTLKKH